MPRGGKRPGAGRKPKNRATAALHGSRRRSVVRFPTRNTAPASATTPATTPIGAPAHLAPDVGVVWNELAPLATAAGTLTDQTAPAFELLCRQVALERTLAASASAVGGSDHRGVLNWIAARYKDFALSPFGKPVVAPKAETVDPFEEFA